MATRNGSAVWKGDLKDGSGDLQVGEGVFEGAYSHSSRFEDGQGTNPEELIAAAHAACFSMALGNILSQSGHPGESVETTAKVSLRRGDDGPEIGTIELVTTGRVPGIDQEHFAKHAEEAKAGCAVSKALAGVGEITLTATLED
ncbi:MAG: OsmC family protein [Solirubrobacterales bacterium]|nr:OsmC family protein [Solirubrobacterales bacterium]